MESPITFLRWQEDFDSTEEMEWSAGSGPIHYWLLNALGCNAEINVDTVTIADIHVPTLNWVKIEISKVGSQEQWKNFGFKQASGAKSKLDYLL